MFKASWMKYYEDIFSDTKGYINFMKKNGVTDLYLKFTKNPEYREAYRKLVRELTKNNIIVHATNGTPDWVLDTSHVKHFLNAVHEYNNESQSDECFHHIHLDIEPYKLSGWNRDRESKGSIIKSWDKIVDFYIAYTDIPVSATIPFWLYNEDVVLEQLYIFSLWFMST